MKTHTARKPTILSRSIAFVLSVPFIAFSSHQASAATVSFDADANGFNGVTDSAFGSPYAVTFGTTATFIDPLISLTNLIAGSSADIFRFGGNGQTLLAPATVNVSTSAVAGLTFGSTGGNGYSLSAGSAQELTIGTSGIAVNAGAFPTSVGSANLGITLGGAQTWANSSANTLTIGGAITNSTNLLTLQALSAGDINVTGATTGGTAGGITVNSTGTGRVILSGNNTHTGETLLSAGIVRATTSAGALGAGGLRLTGGTLQLTDGLAYNRNTIVGDGANVRTATIQSDNTAVGAGTTSTLGTLLFNNAATTLNVTAGAFVTSGNAGVTFGAVTLGNNGNVINTNNSFFNSAVTTTTTLASVGASFGVTFGGTGTTTVTGLISGTGANALTKNGTGTLNINGVGNNPGTGTLTINGGAVNIGAGGTLGTRALTFGGTGGLTYNSAAAGTLTQNMGALTFTAGQGTVTSVFTTGVTSTALTFSSLAARAAGATGNFVTTGGTNGTTNSINLTGAALGFQNQGLFFNGANYAYVNAAGTFLRAPVYGTDANFTTIGTGATLGTTTAATHMQATGAITAQGTASIATLRLGGSAFNFTQTTGTTLTLAQNGIIRAGGVATTIASSTTTAATLTGTGELVINTNAAADSITFSGTNDVNITGFTGLTKTGAGTLTLGNAANTFTGAININGGVLNFESGYSNTDAAAALGAAGARNIVLNGGTLRNASAATFNPVAATKAIVVGSRGGTVDINGLQLQLDDAGQLSGTGNLTLTNGSATGATVILGQAYALSGNIIVNPATTGAITLLLQTNAGAGGSAGNTIVMANNLSALDLRIGGVTSNIFVGGTGIAGGGAIISGATGGGTAATATLTLTDNTTITTANGITLNGTVTDAGRGFGITKGGGGFLTFNGANTFSGGVTIASTNTGQLALGNNSALGTGTLTVQAGAAASSNIVASSNLVMTNNVVLGANMSFGSAGNVNVGNMSFGALDLGAGVRTINVPILNMTTAFTGAVTNGTGLTVNGLGTLALSGTGSFTGPVTVNGGGVLSVGATTLNAAGSVNIGTTVTSSLNFNADNVGAAATLASNSTVALGGTASQALLGFQLGNISNYDSLNLTGATGNVTVGAAGAVISITPLTGFTPAPSTTNTYNLITTSGGGTISNFGNISLPFAALPTGFTYTFTTSATSAVLGVTAGAAGNLFWRGDVNGSWNGGAGTADTNWNNAADDADALFTPNSTNTVNFSSTGLAGATPVTTTLDQNFSAAGIIVNNTNTGALTVNQGTFGTLTLGTGGINVNTGGPTTTTINAPLALGGAQTWTVADAAQTLSIQGAVSGAFGVTLAGAGKVTLGGFNTFSGGLTTGAGQININNGGSTTTNSALGTGTVNFAGATTLDNTSGVAQAVLTTGAQTWGGDVVFTGTNSLSLGTGGITLGANRNVTVDGGTLQLGGVIANQAFGITKLGTGALTLSGANANTGQFVLSAGRVNVNSAAALGAAAATLALNGGTIDNTSGAAVVSTAAGLMTWGADVNFGGSAALSLPGSVTLTADRTVTTNGPGLGINTNALTLTGTNGGAFNLIKNGSGSLILTGNNTFGGATKSLTLSAGTLAANHATNNVFGAAGTTLIINGGALDAIIASAPAANYAQTWGGDFAFLGTNSLNLGTGAITAAAGTRTITVVQNTLTLGGAISDTNTPAITLNGGGTLALTGANLYTGTTTINQGSTLNLGAGGANGSLNGTTGTALVLKGGVFNYSRTGTVTQDMAGVTVGQGRSVILNSAAAQTMALGAITRTVPGGTLELRPFAGSNINTSTANTVGILGGWAVFNAGASWAVGNGAGVAVTGLATFTATTTAGTTAANYTGFNIDVDSSAGLIDGTIAPNSLRFNNAAGATITLAAGVNTIDSGGILVTPTAAGGISTITGGSIAGSAGANGDLIINHWGTTGALNINSVIADNPAGGSTTSLTKSGTIGANNGIAVIGGSFGSAVGGGSIINTFTGSVFMDIGTLTVNGSSVTGGNLNGSNAGPLNQRPIFLNGGTLSLAMDGDATGLANSIDLTAGVATKSSVTVNGSPTINVGRLGQGTVLTAATPAMFTTALNKTIKMGALSFGNDGRTLTVTPSNGYGLEFTGTTTLDKNLTTINVGTFTASNVVQGLTLSGQVTGSPTGGVWTKAGTGVVVLNNATNNFVSNIAITGGMLAFNSDAALGDTANDLFLNAGAANSGIRAFGGTAASPLSISLNAGRQITFNNTAVANNVIEVAGNTTLTLNSAFGLANNGFTKADPGTLVLSADNGIWAGQLSIAAGAVRVTNAGALGISTSSTVGNTVVAATGGALQLSGVSIWDQLNIVGTGINTGGALQALAGTTNTTNGFITLGGAATIGADSTATLNIRGAIGGAQPVTFAGAGTINVDTTALGTAITAITKIGSGTTTLAVANPGTIATITVNAGTLALGGSVGAGAGSVGGTGAISIFPGGTLSVDNSVGTGLSNRLGGGAVPRPITMSGGSLSYTGHASVPSSETLGAATFNRGESTITVTAGANAGASLILGAPTLGTGATALFRGSALGSAPGNGVATIASTTTGFTFVGAGAAGTISKGILPWALVDASASGTGTSFATADTATGNLRALNSSEYLTSLSGLVSSANIVLGAADRLAGSSTINSLTLTSTGAVNINPLQTLTVGGGATVVGVFNTAATTISGGLVTSGGIGGVIFHANADITLDSVLVGSAGGSPAYLTKTGAGILTLNKANAFIGQTAINQGTLKLAGGNNTLFMDAANSFMAINAGGTLDLNGNSQQVRGFFSDGAYSTPTAIVTGGAGSTLVTNSDARNWGGVITGSVAFQRGGTASATSVYSDNDYTGATLISGGTITLRDAGRLSGTSSIGIDYGGQLIIDNQVGTLGMADRVRDGAPVTFRGGNIVYNGRNSNANNVEVLGALNLAQGASQFGMAAGTGTTTNELRFTSFTRDGDATTNIQTAAGQIGSAARLYFGGAEALLVNNILPWAANGGNEFMSYNATMGIAPLSSAGYAGFDGTVIPGTTQPTQNIRIAAVGTVAADMGLNSLSISGASNVTFGVAGATAEVLNLTSGGLLKPSGASVVIGELVDDGRLTAGGTADTNMDRLFISSHSQTLTINSRIVDNGTDAVRLIFTGYNAATLSLTNGANSYSGGTVVNGWAGNTPTTNILQLNGGVGQVVIPAGGLTLNNGQVTMVTNGGQINAANTVTLNGPSTLTLVGANSLAGLAFNVDGGVTTGPTVAAGAGALTLTGGITASGSNPNAIATIGGAGGLNLNGTTNYAMVVNGFSFNSQLVAPLNATLSITAAITNGGITKTGNGLLSLSGANTFASGVDLQAGGIAIANNAAIGVGGTLLVSGNNTTLTADATGGRIVTNPVTLGNSATTINLGNYGAGTLTLSGPTTWSTTSGVARTLDVNAVTGGGVTINTQTLAGVITSAGTGNGIIKTGIGTLAITGNNAATLDLTGANAVTVNNGLIQINADTALGAVPGVTQADNILLNGGGLSASTSFTVNSARGINVGPASGTGSGVLDVGASLILTYGGVIANNASGVGGFVKTGAGNLVLTGVNTYTGQTVIGAGIINANSSSALGDGTAATNGLVFSGGSLQATGTIASPATRPVSLNANATIDTNAQSVSLAGVVSGGVNSGSLTKIGNGTLTLSGANTFTGATTLNAGGLTLDYSTQDNSKLSDTAALTLGGGTTVTLSGGTHGETVLSTTLNPGGLINVVGTAATATLNLNTITRNAGATVNFSADNIATTDSLNVNGILGAWATVGGANYAANSTNLADGLIVGLSTYTDVTRQSSGTKTITSLTTDNVRIIEGTGGSPASITPFAAGTTDINTLLQSSVGGTGASTYDPGTTDILRLGAAGGILMDPTAGALDIGTVANDGFLTAGGNVLNGVGSLTLTNNSASNFTVNSAIANNGSGAVSLGVNGTGNVILTGTNTYNGGTSIDAGSLTIGGTGTLGTSANTLTMNGGALKLGTTSQTVGAVSITAPALSGNTIENGTLAGTSYAVSNTTGNVIIASNLAGGAATLTKTGAGTLTLSGTYSYTGATSVNAGTMVFGGNSTGTTTVTANNAGSIIQIASATGLTASNPVSITAGTVLDLNGNTVSIGALTSVATSTITNTSTSTGASTATSVNTPSGAGVYVDALNTVTATTTVAALITDGATRKTQITFNNANGGALFSNTANTFSGGVVLLNSVLGTRLSPGVVTGTPYGSGPIIIGQTATDKAGIFFASATTFNNPIIFNTALGTDRVGIRAEAALTLTGVITANLAPATFTSNSATGGSVAITGQVTGSSGLVVDINSLASAATQFSVTLNNSGFANDYAGDTVVNFAASAGKSATLILGQANQLPHGAGMGNVILNTNGTGVGTLNLAGFSDTINGLSGSGTVDGTSGTPTLTFGAGNATGTNFSGIIRNTAGTLGVTKIGSGTQTLSGPNTFSGVLNVNGGTLAFGAATNLGNATVTNTIGINGGVLSYTGSGPASLVANQVVTLGASHGTIDTSNLLGALTLSGGVNSTNNNLTKTGPGSLILSAASNLGTGGVAVDAGALIVNTTLTSSATTVASAATLGGTGTLTSSVTINAGGMLSPATGTTAGTLTIGSLTLNAGSLLAYEFGGTNDLVAVTTASGLTLNGGALNLYTTGGVSPLTANGTYDLFNYLSGFVGSTANLTVANSQGGKTYAINDTGSMIQLVLGTAVSSDWSGTNGDGSWTTDGAGGNWNGGTQPDSLGAVANFGNLAITPQTVTLNGGKTVGSIIFDNANSFTIGTNTDAITLNNGIAAGAISATNGSHTVNAPVALGGNANITPGTGTGITFGGIISGIGRSLTFSGAGASTLNAVNTYSGGTTLSAGTLNLGNDAALGSGPLTIGAGTTIDNTKGSLLTSANNNAQNWNGSFTFTGTESMDLGTGAVTLGASPTITTSNAAKVLTVGGAIGDGVFVFGLTKAGPGTLVLGGVSTYNGATSITAGTLSLTGSLTGGGAISTSGTGSLSQTSTGVISGASAFTQGSSGASVLAGNNSAASGGVTLATGLLNINSDNALGTGRLTLSGGTFDNTDTVAHTQAGNPAQTWTNAATVAFTGTQALNLGAGAVTLGTDATVGTFVLTNNSALAGTSLTVGGNISAIAGGTAGAKTLTINGTSTGTTLLSGNLSRGAATGLIVTDSLAAGATLSLSGTSTIQTLNITTNGGIVDLTGGNLSLANAGAGILLASNNATLNGGTITLTTGTAGTATTGQNYADFGASTGTLTVNSLIAGSPGIGVDFHPNLGGTTVLTNANTFSGPAMLNTTVSVSSIGNIGVAGNLGTGATLGTNPAAIMISNTAGAGTLIYTGTGEVTNKTLGLSASTATSTIDMAGTGTLRFSATGNLVGNVAGIKTLALRGSTAGIGQIDQNIVNTTNGGALISVSKLGTGKWILGGTNTYTGATTINDGTLEYTAAGAQTLGALTFGSAAASTAVGTLNLAGGNITYAAGLVQTNSTNPNTINVGTGSTLTFSSGLTLGFAATAGSPTDTKLTATGGSMVVNGSSVVVGTVGTGTQNDGWFNRAVLDVSALASFSANVTDFNIGVGNTLNPTGSVLLSNTANTILATTLRVADNGGQNGKGPSTVTLGTGTNVIQADTINIGIGKGSGPGVLNFVSQTAGSPGTVTIANKVGTGAANITVANINGVSTGGGAIGTLDLRGHVATVNAGTLLISNNNGTSTGSTSGTVSFDAGTFNVATLNIAPKAAAGVATATGTLNVGGGAFTVNTAFTLGSQATAGTSVATLNLTGGTFTSNPAITQGGGTTTSTINLDGGILNMTNDAIGTAGNIITLNAKQGTLQNLSQLNGGGNLTKTTAGTLIMGGTNAYTGSTIVQDGTLEVTGALTGTPLVDVLAGVLELSGSISGQVTLDGGTLTGNSTSGTTGRISGLATLSAGTVNPGAATGTASGQLLMNGGLTFSGASAVFDLNGTTVGTEYDQLSVVGPVTLDSNVPFTLSVGFNFQPTPGNVFTLVANDDTDAVAGGFKFDIGGASGVLDQGENFLVGAHEFQISYMGGTDTNDITVTYVVPEPGSAALLLGGLAMLAGRRRRKQA